MDGDAPPVPEPPIKRGASAPVRDAPRRKAKTVPPPPPGSSARKALEDKILELRELHGEPHGESQEPPRRPSPPPGSRPPPPPRPRTGAAPVAGKRPVRGDDDPIDLASLPEADRTKENRGAVGIKHDRNTSLTANAASGTIGGGDTPAPIFDRAAIAAGQRGALASERVGVPIVRAEAPPGGAAAGSGPSPRPGTPPGPSGPAGGLRTPARGLTVRPALIEAGNGAPARGTPDLGAIVDQLVAAESAEAGEGAEDDSGEDFGEDFGEDAALDSEAPARRTAPVGELAPGRTVLEQERRRSPQAQARAEATIKRDAATARLDLSEPAPEPRTGSEIGFDDPTAIKPRAGGSVFDEPTRRSSDGAFEEPTRRGALEDHGASGASTGRFERDDADDADDGDRGDPTIAVRPEATVIAAPAARHAPTGTLRPSASLPRRPGVAGDLRYVATVVLGLRSARRELAAITARQITRQQSRRHHLITLGRAAVTADGFDHAGLAAARDKLASIEEERAQHAGHVVAADAELTRVRRDRETRAQQHATELAAVDAELAALAGKLEPLEKEAAATRKRGVDLHESLRRIDGKIAATEASLESAKGGKLDRAQVQAEIATLRADRKAIQADEPAIAGQLDALNPRIAALEATAAEAGRKRAELEAAERDDQRRVEELLDAIGAKRKVVDRAAADAEAARDKILFQLGERLHVDRPGDLAAEFAPIDAIDLEIGDADRRIMELREVLGSVDRWKLARGIALVTLVVAALGAIAAGLILYHPWRWL